MAFYAALSDTGNIGPFQAGATLKYSKVFTNIGDAYNNSTGEPRQRQTAPAPLRLSWFPLLPAA